MKSTTKIIIIIIISFIVINLAYQFAISSQYTWEGKWKTKEDLLFSPKNFFAQTIKFNDNGTCRFYNLYIKAPTNRDTLWDYSSFDYIDGNYTIINNKLIVNFSVLENLTLRLNDTLFRVNATVSYYQEMDTSDSSPIITPYWYPKKAKYLRLTNIESGFSVLYERQTE